MFIIVGSASMIALYSRRIAQSQDRLGPEYPLTVEIVSNGDRLIVGKSDVFVTFEIDNEETSQRAGSERDAE